MKLRLNLFQIRDQLNEVRGKSARHEFKMSSSGDLHISELGISSSYVFLELEEARKLRDWLNQNLGEKS